MNKEFIEAYDKMSINGKRNELNNELKVMNDIIKCLKTQLELEDDEEREIEHYNNTQDQNMTDSEFLTQTYKNIYLIEQNIFDIANIIFSKEDTE